MIVDPNRLVTWQEFVKQPHISRLSLNEQTSQYTIYLHQYHLIRAEYIRGSGRDFFLQQENLFYILQENGGRIKIT